MHYVIIGVAIILVGMSAVIATLKNQNDKLNIKTGELAQANVSLTQSMNHLTNSIVKMAAELTVAVAKTSQVQEQVDKQKEIFNKHTPADITNIALRKPGLLENRVNAATTKVFLDIEKLTDPDYEP